MPRLYLRTPVYVGDVGALQVTPFDDIDSEEEHSHEGEPHGGRA